MLTVIFLKRSLLLLCVAALTCASAGGQSVIYRQDWSGYADGASVIGNGFRWLRPAPAGSNAAQNSAIVQEQGGGQKFLALTSHGYTEEGFFNPSLVSTVVTPSASLSLSPGKTSVVDVLIRYVAPGSKVTMRPYPTVRVDTDAGQFWFGFASPSAVFVVMPEHGQMRSHPGISAIDPNAWYRFRLAFMPADKQVSFEVYHIGQGGNETLLWSTASVDALALSVSQIRSYRLEVSSPGKSADYVGTCAFGSFTVSQ